MKPTFAFFTGASLGTVAGAAAMLVAFPFLFPPPAANEPLPVAVPAALAAVMSPVAAAGEQAGPVELAGFVFDEMARGRDAIHWANGSGRVLDTGEGRVLRLEADFEAGPGPNFWVYLNTRPVVDEVDFNADADRIKLAPLRAFSGAQNYVLPEGIDLSAIHTVTIWCETFGVYIGSAALVA